MSFQVAWSWWTTGASSTPSSANCGWGRLFFGCLSMIRSWFKRSCCHQRVWKNRSSTSFWDWKTVWYQLNVSKFFAVPWLGAIQRQNLRSFTLKFCIKKFLNGSLALICSQNADWMVFQYVIYCILNLIHPSIKISTVVRG